MQDTGDSGKSDFALLSSAKAAWESVWLSAARLRTHDAIITTFVASALVVLVAWTIQSRIEERARAEIGNALTTVLETARQSVHEWSDERAADAMIWAQFPEIVRLTEALLATARTREALKYAPAQTEIRTLLRPVLAKRGYRGYFIIAPDATNLASSRNINLGVPNLLTEQGKILERIFAGNVALSLSLRSDVPMPGPTGEMIPGQPTMFVGAPITNSAGLVIAALTFRIDPVQDFTRILRQGRIGKTGETYAFDSEGTLISESRFDDELRRIGLIGETERGFLSIQIRDPGGNMSAGYRPTIPRDRQPLTRMARSAIAGESGLDLDGYNDYRGVPVIGAWTWDKELGFGIATEINVAEAYDFLRTLGYSALITAVFTIGLIFSLTGIFLWSRNRALEGERRFRATFDQAAVGIAQVSPDGRFLRVNRKFCEIAGYDREELLERSLRDIMHPGDFLTETMNVNKLLAGEIQTYATEERYLRKDGSEVWISPTVSLVHDASGDPEYFILAVKDISERKRAEEEMRLAATVFEHSTAAVAVTDAENRILSVNPAFCEITGYAPEEVIGKKPSILKSGRQGPAFYKAMWRSIKTTGRWQGEIWNRRKDGEVYPEWLSIVALKDENGDIQRHIAIFSDITLRRRDEETIRHQANYDEVTNLPNRALFMDRLSQALAGGRRDNTLVAVMFIDLDRFKKVNDTFGHDAGDELLQEAALRLISCVRESDTVARLGGDEFTIILPNLQKGLDAELVAHKILERLAEPYEIRGTKVFVTGSIGVTLYPNDGEDEASLLKNADTAMYKAKEHGRDNFRFFTEKMNAEARKYVALENDLRHALEGGELFPLYQPIVDLEFGRVVGAETLLRWRHPERGIVLPDEFIPLAEETGLIVPIGEWVMRAACEQAVAWRKAGIPPLNVAVNLSTRQCLDTSFGETIERVLKKTGMDPAALTLEITESLLLEDRDESAVTALQALRKMGVRLSLDDFGTGYSSLSYLKRFPIDVVKIDRTFVRNVATDPEDLALIEAIIAMAHSLGIKVVGEGIEMEEQGAFLLSRHCDFAQGFYFSKPIPADQFAAFVLDRIGGRPGAHVRSG